ncbi:MAG: hypothetical protein DRH26_15855, partial [Deltaproteobacteria bacterium]
VAFDSAWNVVSGNTLKVASGQIEVEIEATAASAAGFSTVAADLLMDHVFLNDVWATPSADVHFGLTTATMADASTLASITEASGTGYARKPVPASSFDAAASGANVTNTDVDFAIPSADLGTITSLFICNVLSGTSGILIAYDNSHIIDQPVNADDEVVVEAGSFTATLN